jgi:hypothetical protein
LRLLALIIARVGGAGIAILASLYIIYAFGKETAGEYFLHFTLAYFIAQIIRFGGENDILSAHHDSAVAQSCGVTMILALIAIVAGAAIDQLLPGYSIFLMVVAGSQIALLETYGDILKRHGYNLTGIIYSSAPMHIFIVLISALELTRSLEHILVISTSTNLVLALVIERVVTLNQNISLKPSKAHVSEAAHSAAGNILAGVSNPISLWMCTVFFGAATSADFRIATRLAMLISFSFFALRQMLMKPLREQGLDAFNGVNHFYRYVNLRVMPLAVVMTIGNIIVATGLVYWMDEFDTQFLMLVISWSCIFLVMVALSPALMLITYRRDFSLLLRSRVVSQLVSFSVAWFAASLGLVSGPVAFSLIIGLHVWIAIIPGVFKSRQYFSRVHSDGRLS